MPVKGKEIKEAGGIKRWAQSEAFKAIDKAQKIEFQAKSFLITTELFWWAAIPALFFLLVSATFSQPGRRKEALA